MKNNRGNKKNTFTRLIKTLFEFYPVLLPVIIVLILFNSVVSCITYSLHSFINCFIYIQPFNGCSYSGFINEIQRKDVCKNGKSSNPLF